MNTFDNPNPTHANTLFVRVSKCPFKKRSSSRKQRGFDLIQLGIVVALVGMLLSGSMIGVPRVLNNIKTGQQVDDLRSAITIAQSEFSHVSASALTNTMLRTTSLYSDQIASGTGDDALGYKGRFGSTVTVNAWDAEAPGHDATRTGIQITVPAPQKACARIVKEVAPLAFGVKVGSNGTVSTLVSGPHDMTTLVGYCNAPHQDGAYDGQLSFSILL